METSSPPTESDQGSYPAPLNKNGKPDFYKYMPSRLVSLEEAERMGWPMFYIATPCKYGHLAPRYTKNPRICVDCKRHDAGKPYIGGKALGDWPEKGGRISNEHRLKMRLQAAKGYRGQVIHTKASAPEPTKDEKNILDSYAETRDLEHTSTLLGISHASIEARIAYSPVFKEALELLEKRLGIKRKLNPVPNYIWTEAKRSKLVEVYVDTGDLASARDSIDVTPSEYFRELDRNSDFADRMSQAAPLAARALEERAIQLALAGNDRLLQKVLSAKLPEYRERVDIEVTQKLDDRQLNARLTRILGKLRPLQSIVEGQVTVIRDSRGTGEEEEPAEAGHLLQHSGS